MKLKIAMVLFALLLVHLDASAGTSIKYGVDRHNEDYSNYLSVNHSVEHLKAGAQYYNSNSSESCELRLHYDQPVDGNKNIFVYTMYQQNLKLGLDNVDFGLGGGVTFDLYEGVKFKPSFAYVLREDTFIPSLRLKFRANIIDTIIFNATGNFIGSQSKIETDAKFNFTSKTSIGFKAINNRVADSVDEIFKSYLEVKF